MLALMPRCLAIAMVCVLALLLKANAQPYGLDARPAFTAFNNGALPMNASTISGTWSTVPAWPALTFQNPLGIVQEPGTQSMIVWEREGRVYRFDKATGTNKSLMLDLSANTQGWDDCGLLNLICHPNYAVNKFVFIYYVWVPAGQIRGSSTTRPATFKTNWKRLSRFTVKPDGTIDPSSETVLVHQKCESLWHGGSGMFFHPDNGFLYFINGEDFVPSKAQKLDGGLFSGIFRIDVDNRGGSISHTIPRQPLPGSNDNTGSYTANYMIPNDNPLVGQSGVLEEYFALGVRSPHRLTYDAVTGRMFHSDVGDASREEINVVEPTDVLPNYQWPKFEGLVGDMTAPFIGQNKKPVLDYTHADGSAVIGGLVYRGNAFPELKGKYIFGDNMVGTIWYLDESTTPASKIAIAKLPNGPGPNTGDNYVGLSSFGVDADGELYITRMSYTGGAVFKLSRTGGNPNTMPATLSQTSIFSDLANLTTSTGFIAYDVNTPLWSDGAFKQRWFAVPTGQRIGYAPTGEWSFPTGSVFVKHFDLGTDETNAAVKRRLETRILVRDNQGFVYGGTYKWRTDLSDADLVSDTQTEDITITTAMGTRTQTWTFPGRQACLQCHTPASKGVLGLNTPQNHRDHLFTETGITDNQLRAWSHVGYFTPSIDEASLASLPSFASLDNASASIELRARSYLDANCSHCHRPGGTSHAMWDARFETPLAAAGILNGRALNDLGTSGSRIVLPKDVLKSVLHKRLSTATESYAMPPIAKSLVDAPAVAVIAEWINSLPASPAQPPSIAGSYLKFGGTWGSGGLGASPAGEEVTLIHQTAPPSKPSDPQPERPSSWYGMELKGDGYLMARVTHYPSATAQMGLMARSSLVDGAGGIAGIYGPVSQPPNEFPATWMLIGYGGATLTKATSSDGQSWSKGTFAGRPARTYLGLWLSAGTSGSIAPPESASFDHVRFFPTVPWACSSQPSSQLALVGDLVEFGIETDGLPPTSYQWRKNNSSISRAVADRYAFKAALSSAGSYNVLTGGRLLSSSANLVVLDKVTYSNNLAPGSTATFTLAYAGTGATFQWTKDGVPLQNSTHITGATTAKLSVKALTLADIGDYECVVTGYGATQVLGPYHLHVLSKPTITAAAPLAWSVSRAFTWQLSADEPVSSYVVGGLPSGLSYNAITGLISGTPNVGGNFTINVYARNAAGSGVTRSYTLSIEAFPAPLMGSFAGLVDRDAANGQLGGRLTVTLSSNGTASGTLLFGASAYSLNKRAVFISGSDPTLDLTIKRTGNSDLVLHLTLHAAGTISGDANGVLISARRLVTSAGANTGTYYASLDPATPGNVLQPQGSGWAKLIVSSNGGVTISGRMAENSSIGLSATLRDDGSIVWHQTLYNNKGSARGTPAFASGAITGAVDWQKTGAASSSDRTYASGFPLLALTVDGLKFVAPAPHTTFLGNADATGNARIEFTHGGIGDAAPAPVNVPDQTFRLTEGHKAIFDGVSTNPCLDSLTITSTSGYFTGTLKLKDGVLSRTVTYQGVSLPGRSQARGAFTLRQLPGDATSPILSGAVVVKAWP